MIGKSFLMVVLLLFSIPIASFADDNNINGTCPGEVIEEINGTTTDASHTENGGIGWGGNDRYRMTFNVDGNLTIHAYNRKASSNENYYFYVSRDSCGNDDADWNIISKEYGKEHQTTIKVHNGDTIYVRLQSIKTEPNNGKQWYSLSLDFKSACHGCDCSLDNNKLNSSNPGVSIVGLDGATDDINKCFSGITDQAEGDPDKKDYYNFTAGVDGSAAITTSSPNGHKYHMTVWVNGDPVYGDDDNTNVDYTHSVGTLYLNKGDKVIMKFKESGDDLDEYQVNVSFSKFVCGGCDCSLDREPDNDTSAGVVIPDLDGATTDVNKCISGHSTDDDEDYYNFTVQSDGELKITTSSPNNHDFYLIVKKNGTEVYPKTASQNHNVSTIDLKSGDNVILYFKETGNDLDEYQANLEFKSKFTPPSSGSIDNLCYENVKIEDALCPSSSPSGGVNPCKKESVIIKNIGVATLSNLKVDFDTTGKNLANLECGKDGSSGNCSEETTSNYGTQKDILRFDMGSMAFNEAHTLYEISEEQSDIIGDRVYATFDINGKTKSKKLNMCPKSYCKENHLNEGFHIIDPDGGDEGNSFEVYCDMSSPYAPRDLLALPIKTSNNYNNNFLYDTDRLSTVNYYEEAKDHSKSFQAVEFDAYSKKVVVRSEEPLDSGKGYSTMGGMFSNINLIGTPFGIDWSNTNIDHCDTTKLRKAYHGQAVKVNLLDYTNARCEVEQIQLKLLDDYKYLTYLGAETLEHSCKEMSENVPANILASKDIKGHYWIYPRKDANDTTTKRDDAPNDITRANERPIVVYCWYQTDLDWAWTFLLSLDGVVTNSKNDIVAKQDTCSQLGLWFFVPNSKDTFDRVRKYLLDQKTGDLGWENYTGTVREKYKTYKNEPDKEYYLRDLGYELIWPYGPLGIYYPCRGNYDATNGCSYNRWYPGKTYIKGWMSGSPMHNITTLTNYADSMGAKGWVSILGSQDLNITDDWWISDIGAGEEFGPKPPPIHIYSYNPHGTHILTSQSYPYYEPNGNYTKYAWLNFLHDDEGWIYHNDDNWDFYAYYDYMCMSETNYITATRYLLVPGFFNTLERGTRSGNTRPNFNDDRLTTQIVGKPIKLDLILYKFDINGSNIIIDRSRLTDMNKSVGVFLATKDENNQDKIKILKFLGGYKNFTDKGGRIELPTFTMDKSYRNLFLHYYYCNDEDMNWTQCWDYQENNTTGEITVTHIANTEANASDSYDSFAVRPDAYKIENVPSTIVAGEEFNLTLRALDANGSNTLGYNRPVYIEFDSPSLGIQKKSACIKGKLEFTKNSATAFTDGLAKVSLTYSEVGDINITLSESPGTEYAKIDANDTDFNLTIHDNGLGYTPAEQDIYREINRTRAENLSFTPSYFDVNGTFKDFHIASSTSDMNYTYLSNDLNMSSSLDFEIIAKNKNGDITQNYNEECDAKDININISYLINSAVARDTNDTNPNPGGVDKIKFDLKDERNISYTPSPNEQSLSDRLDFNVSRDVFNTDHNGSAMLSLKINFDRKKNVPVQPFIFSVKDMNITDTNGVDNNITQIAGEATYLYGRVKSSQELYDDVSTNSTKTPISIVVYSLPAGAVTLDSSLFTTTNDYDWVLNTIHDASKDGVVELETTNSNGTVTPMPTLNSGMDSNVVVTATNAQRPLEVDVNLTGTDDWLIFNINKDEEPSPFYKVRFIGGVDNWTGYGETGKVVDTNSSRRKTKRLEW